MPLVDESAVRPHRVAVLVRPGVMPLELGAVHQLFGTARRQEGPAAGTPLYDVVTCTVEPGRVPTDADFALDVPHGPDVLDEAGTVLVPATHAPDQPETGGTLTPALATALTRLRPGARIASICTGAFVLAAAGLLDGRRATTHWQSAAAFGRLFPHLTLDAEVLFTDDGDVLTSAGEAAGIDLCLHLIRRDHGAAVAADVARRTVVPPYREGGQAQYVPHPIPEAHGTSTAPARAWALEHLDRPVPLHELAAHASMSVRTFTRRFRSETGCSPGRWLTRQRVERARVLLEETDRPVDAIAGDVGFGTGASLRAQFRDVLGVSPIVYRTTFRGGIPSD
ncbi:helix-turn-helix domain-containing protein [Prauserella halophila]|uniref:Helix-turn-helix domain-containing protein n=1 Tax=Prauserella halophila TaxID=185641 RepID=A0ABN1VUV7_9PSEU|nr:helix-turn-helix domain-containing protein [Prauserella halophila]MCP2234444.1 Transcriptional regulator GlxA family, contains an amidase domain and an AraC-type DNA-binding HTH domain [Prauserella halophila]